MSKVLGTNCLSLDKLTKVGQIDLKLERTAQNWDELDMANWIWNELTLSSLLVPIKIRTNQLVPLFFRKFVPAYVNSYQLFQTFDILL